MNKKVIITIVIVAILVTITIIAFKLVNNAPEVDKVHSIKKIGSENCKLSYEKLCFNIPDDYKCVGNNKCQLSNDKDMLLVQIYLDEDNKDSLDTYIKRGKNGFSRNFVDIEEQELNGNKWTVINNKHQDIRNYLIKVGNSIYKVKILSKRDSGGKFNELTKTIEESLRVNK